MSDDLIKRADAISKSLCISFNGTPRMVVLLDDIKAIPSVDRPQGEWIEQHENGHGFWVGRCSRCSAVSRVTEYCPDCGAKMERSRR